VEEEEVKKGRSTPLIDARGADHSARLTALRFDINPIYIILITIEFRSLILKRLDSPRERKGFIRRGRERGRRGWEWR